jgi:D-alanine-D-alanine ligase
MPNELVDEFLADLDLEWDSRFLQHGLNCLYSRLRIAVIHGGDSRREGAVIYKTHNPRSTKTYEKVAQDIAEALRSLGFRHVFVMADDMQLPQKLNQENIHLAWLNTGGVQGYNPVCQTPALLEMLGIPYVGHNPLNSSILDQKHIFKRELQSLEISTPPFITWHMAQGLFQPHLSESFARVFADYKGHFLVKPVSGRASLNIHYVETIDGLAAAIENVHRTTHSTALIETYCPGREFCVSVCGSVVYANQRFYRKTKPFAFSILERRLEPGEYIFTSMDKRAITSDRIRSLDDELELKQNLAEIAQKIYQNLYLNTLIRVDLRADQNDTLQVLEANPKPDLKRPDSTVTSLVAQGLNSYGMSYEDLILTLLSDRLNYLITYHSKTIQHIVEMID